MVRPELVRLLGQYGKTVDVTEVVPPDQIDDWDELVERRDKSFNDPVYHQQICARMTEVLRVLLPNITCLHLLATMWQDALVDSADKKQIGARIQEVVKNSTDWYEMDRLWYDSPYGSIIEGVVRERIAQLISEVSANKCPDWFLALLRDPYNCAVPDVLEQKVAELKKELNITD